MPIHIIPERTRLTKYTTTENANYIGLKGEITANVTSKAVVYHDGDGNSYELARADGDNWTTDPLAGFSDIASAKSAAQSAASVASQAATGAESSAIVSSEGASQSDSSADLSSGRKRV